MLAMPMRQHIAPKVRLLRDNIRAKGWCITAFNFFYNKHQYITLFEDAKALGSADKYVIATITFIDRMDQSHRLSLFANTMGFYGTSPQKIMNFFGISYTLSLKGFMQGLAEDFNTQMPEQYVAPSDLDIKKAVVTQLGHRNHDPDPEAIYCCGTKRNAVKNGRQEYRTVFNSNKAQLLVPKLYELLKNETTLSFCFSSDHSKKLSDEEILAKRANCDMKKL